VLLEKLLRLLHATLRDSCSKCYINVTMRKWGEDCISQARREHIMYDTAQPTSFRRLLGGINIVNENTIRHGYRVETRHQNKAITSVLYEIVASANN